MKSARSIEESRGTAWQWALLTLTTLAAAALRAQGLAAKTFWLDEGMSVGIARLDWYNFARILWRREGNMSLYYLLLRFWLHLGNGEAFVRALSVAFAVATVPALYFLGRYLFDGRVGLIAAALLAANAFHVRWSQEARSYSLLVLLCVLSSLFFVRCVDDPSRRNRVAWILFSALAVYAHFFAGLLLLAQWISLRLLRPEVTNLKRDFRWCAVAIFPVVLFIATTGAGPLRWVQRPGLRDLGELAVQLTGNGGAVLLIAFLAACVGALAGDREHWREWRVPREAWRRRYLLLWLLFPPLFVMLLSLARPLFVPRYFIFCLPPLLLLAATGVARLRSPWLWTPAALLLVALSLRGTVVHRNDFDPERDDWRSASHFLLSNARPGDGLMFHVPGARMPYEFYLSLAGPTEAPMVLYPRHADHIMFLDFVAKPDYAGLKQQLPQYSRVWLVLSHAGDPGVPDLVTRSLDRILRDEYSSVTVWRFQGIEVRLYSARLAAAVENPGK